MDPATKVYNVRDYDLDATLNSGQAFRWHRHDQGWAGIIGSRWVLLRSDECSITAETALPVANWNWLEDYLQIKVDLAAILRTFPEDAPLHAAKLACHGLRLLRQAPWECLASFILSSTKQIIQIQQIISLLCERFGDPLQGPATLPHGYAFPSAERLARASESDLRSCKMGFRAPYLLATARAIAGGQFELEKLRELPIDSARLELTQLPGVGRKIADCVLLFGYGFQSAFPVDVWVLKALQQLYFPRRKVTKKRLEKFTQTYFGPNAGYAQQYLFHYMRTAQKQPQRPSLPGAKHLRAAPSPPVNTLPSHE